MDPVPGDSRPAWVRSPATLIGVGAACILAAQILLHSLSEIPMVQVTLPTAAGLSLVAIGLLDRIGARIAGRWPRADAALRRWLDPRQSPRPVYLASLAASLTAGVIAGDELTLRLPLVAVGLWLGAIVLMLAASPAPASGKGRLPRLEFLALTALVGLGFSVRALLLAEVPWVLAGDEGSVGLSAREFLDGTWTNVFGVAWYSFPSLFFTLPALSIRLLGPSIEALRLPAAIAGSLTVVALFLYVRAAFGSLAAVFAAGYLATFHFHVHFSRIALNNIWDPLFLTLVSLLVWQAWTQERRSSFIWAGLVGGLGLYFYTSTRILLALLPAWLLLALVRDRARLRRQAGDWMALAVAALVVVLPLATFYARHPEEFAAPMDRVSLLGPRLAFEMSRFGLPAWRILLDRLAVSAGAFTFADLGHWYRIDHPMLQPLPATLFLIGLLLCVLRAGDLRYSWLLLWLAAGVVVGGLSESTPAAQRYIFVAPAVATVVILPLVDLVAAAGSGSSARRALLAAGASGILIAAMTLDLRYYFLDYTSSRRFSDSNTEVAHTLGLFLQQSGLASQGIEVHFSGSPRMNSGSIPSLLYLGEGSTFLDIPGSLDGPPDWTVTAPAVFVFLPERVDDLAWVRQAYPEGETRVQLAADGKDLYTLFFIR